MTVATLPGYRFTAVGVVIKWACSHFFLLMVVLLNLVFSSVRRMKIDLTGSGLV